MISEAEITTQTNVLMDIYREAYQQRYKTQPLHPNISADFGALREVIKLAGFARAKEIVRHYLKMPGNKEYFIQYGHTLELLRNSLNQINANLGAGSGNATGGYDPMIVFETRCPRCEVYFNITCRASEMERRAYTDPCDACVDALNA